MYSQCVEDGHTDVDIEFTRSGISAMTITGQVFEIPFSRCELRFAGIDRCLVLCRNHDRTLTISCRDATFPRALGEAAFGLLDVQLERQFKDSRRRASERSMIGLSVLIGIAIFVAAACLLTKA